MVRRSDWTEAFGCRPVLVRQEGPGHIRLQKAAAVMREHGRAPNGSIHQQPVEPADEEIVVIFPSASARTA